MRLSEDGECDEDDTEDEEWKTQGSFSDYGGRAEAEEKREKSSSVEDSQAVRQSGREAAAVLERSLLGVIRSRLVIGLPVAARTVRPGNR